MKLHLVELYAGTAALSLYLFGHKPPVSRIGSKQGYAAAIAEELGLSTWLWKFDGEKFQDAQDSVTHATLVDTDPWICATLRALCGGAGPEVAAGLRKREATKAAWESTRKAVARESGQLGSSRVDDIRRAEQWLYVTTASRGGVGGFKGWHIRRPSVNGWIPSLPSLCKRLEVFNHPLPVTVLCQRAEQLAPFGDIAAAGTRTVVYMDHPYEGRTGYPQSCKQEVFDGRLAGWVR